MAAGRVEMPREYVDGLRERMLDELRWRHVAGDDGELLGVSASGGRRGLTSLLGLGRSGMIVAVGGAPVDGPETLLAMFRALATEERVELTIARSSRARPETLTIHVTGPPAAGADAWTLEHIGLAPSRDQRRAALGIEVTDGGVTLPRAARETLLDPAHVLALQPVDGDDGEVAGYRVDGWRHERLGSVLGIGDDDLLVAVDGSPLTSRDAVHGLLAGWLGRKRVALTLRGDDGADRERVYTRVGPPLPPPARWGDAGITVVATRDERRAILHIEIDGDRTEVPRDALTALMLSPPRLVSTRGGDGVRTSSRDPGDTWLLLGIRDGEGVTALDGQPLPRFGAADAIGEALQERTSVSLTLSGDGGERALVIEVVDG